MTALDPFDGAEGGLGEGEASGFQLCGPGQGLCPLWASVPPPGNQQVLPESPSSPSFTLIHDPVHGAVRTQPGCG